jgi:hypothetical protein
MTTDPADVNTQTSKKLDVGTSEKYGGSTKDAGFFRNAILKVPEIPTTQSTKGTGTEVKVIANGHVHTADNCRRVKGVWTCFGGGGSYAGYGKSEGILALQVYAILTALSLPVGFDRRFRVFQVSEYGEKIETYKRTEKDEIVDRMGLVGDGAPPPYEGSLL